MTQLPTITAADARDEWVLVPREPTEAMLVNGREALMPVCSRETLATYGPVLGIWSDMIAAAPQPPETAGEDAPVDTWKSVLASLTTALADERDYSLALRALLAKSREYVAEALEAHEHSDGRALLSEIDAALKARSAPTKQAAVSDGVKKACEFLANWYSPWGAWKTAWWEGEVSDNAPMTEAVALRHLKRLLTPTTQEGGQP